MADTGCEPKHATTALVAYTAAMVAGLVAAARIDAFGATCLSLALPAGIFLRELVRRARGESRAAIERATSYGRLVAGVVGVAFGAWFAVILGEPFLITAAELMLLAGLLQIRARWPRGEALDAAPGH